LLGICPSSPKPAPPEVTETPQQVRTQLLTRLYRIAEALPNGLLHRLVDDAAFFRAWNLKKKKARASSRIQQQAVIVEKMEDKRFKELHRTTH
jgi:hypothetical protein